MKVLTEVLHLWDRMLPTEQRRVVEILITQLEAMPGAHVPKTPPHRVRRIDGFQKPTKQS